MVNCDPDSKHHSSTWIFFWKIVEIICLVSVLVFAFTHGAFVDRLQREYPTMSLLFVWLVGMLSYHQDAKRHDPWWAVPSQILSIVCVIAIVVFGFTQRLWLNFFIAPPLAWLHIQFTRRWWARPGTWW